MNAKQVADELENIYWIQGDGKGKPFQQYADFVRQQQAEIEALKNRNWDLVSEPWGFDRQPAKEYKPNQTLECSFDLAGFKPPAKTLTDEEINQVAIDMGMFGDLSHDEIELCRNVLRKAQEK